MSGRARTQLAGAATSKDWVQDHLLLHLKTSNHLPIREAAPNAAEKLHNPPDIANPLITPFIARGLRVTLSLSGLGEGGESREVDALRQFDKQFSCARLQHPSSAAVSSHLLPVLPTVFTICYHQLRVTSPSCVTTVRQVGKTRVRVLVLVKD